MQVGVIGVPVREALVERTGGGFTIGLNPASEIPASRLTIEAIERVLIDDEEPARPQQPLDLRHRRVQIADVMQRAARDDGTRCMYHVARVTRVRKAALRVPQLLRARRIPRR